MFNHHHVKWHQLAVVGLAVLLFIPFLGKVHLFDWDEINFAEAAREMLVTGNWSQVQIDFQPFYEKPPLFIWMQAVCMKLFGIGEFAARLPNAVCGVFSLSFLFFVGRKLKNLTFAWWWVLAYIGSFLPHFYFKSGIIDPWFNLFIFVAIISLAYLSVTEKTGKKKNWIALAGGVSLGLAVLTKGPVALLLTGLVFIVMVIWLRKKWQISKFQLGWFFLATLFTTSLWFGYETVVNGPEFVSNFLNYQLRLLTTEDAGHGGPFYYHILILMVGCFPASAFLLGFWKKSKEEAGLFTGINKWMIAMLAIVVIVFSIVETKIVHYSSLAYFPITFLAANVLHHVQNGQKPGKLAMGFLCSFGFLFSVVLFILPWVGTNIDLIIPYIKDPFTKANLEADVQWNSAGAAIGVFYLSGLLLTIWFFRRAEFSKSFIILFIVNMMTIKIKM